MINSKLLQLLMSFDSIQLDELFKFVRSPIHNEQEALINLYEYIYKKKDDFNETALLKETAWRNVFPKKDFNDVRMRRYIADLYKVCLNYLSWHQLEQNEMEKKILQLQFMRASKLNKHFDSHLKSIQKWKLSNSKSNIQTLHQEFVIEQEISLNLDQGHDRGVEPNLQILSNKLDVFYLSNKLKSCCAITNYQNISKQEYHLPLIEEVLEHLEKTPYPDQPLIGFYHAALLSLLEFENEEHLAKMKSIIIEHPNEFLSEELKDMFTVAKNYIIKKANQNRSEKKYLVELFDLYNLEMQGDSLLDQGFISPFTYKNIVTLGIHLGKEEWTKKFLEDYRPYLPIDQRESVYAFNLSRWHFNQKQFEKIIANLLQVEYHEIFLELDAKVLLIKTYYELDEIETLLSFLDSFKVFLNRKQKLNYHQKSYLALITAVKKLIKLQFASEAKKEKFKTDISQTIELVERNWILAKVMSF